MSKGDDGYGTARSKDWVGKDITMVVWSDKTSLAWMVCDGGVHSGLDASQQGWEAQHGWQDIIGMKPERFEKALLA
jgi:hypothetical protein